MKTSILNDAPLRQAELDACRSYVLSYLEADRKSASIRARQPGPAVTISYQSGSGAHEIAQRLAEALQAAEPKAPVPWTVFDRHLVEKVLEDEAFFEASGGGVTVSGGEALMQMDSVGELFSRLKQRNVHTLIQTAGLFNYKVFENLVLPYTDTIYFDLKLMDSDAHKQYCGVPNHSIHENFRKVQALARDSVIEVLPRVPLVPFITDTDENLSAIADFMLENGVKNMQILPYNPIWLDKLPRFGSVQRLDFGEGTGKFMPDAELDRCTEIFESRGIHVHCHR